MVYKYSVVYFYPGDEIMLVNIKEMLEKAKREKYAVGQFNINNLEWTIAVLKKAEELKSPVILGVSQGAAKYMCGFNVVSAIVRELISSLSITVPVALHLDHGDSVENCKKAIDAGFTSVMIDASHYPYQDNVAITKEVVEYAKKYNVSVEAELGRVGGQEDNVVSQGVVYADVEECAKFVLDTGVDCLAPALGSVHGPYKGEPKLGFKEMLEIKEASNKPLVLHGGSGIPDYQIKEAILRGTCKINVNTECQQEWTKLVRDTLNKDLEVYDPRKVIGPGMKGIEKVVEEKILLFGSNNKA